MRVAWTLLLLSGMALGQTADAQKPDTGVSPSPAAAAAPSAAPTAVSDPNAIMIPAGTMIPLSLKQAISTKNAREGDAVYAETAFPFLVNERVIVPAGTWFTGPIHLRSRIDFHLDAGAIVADTRSGADVRSILAFADA